MYSYLQNAGDCYGSFAFVYATPTSVYNVRFLDKFLRPHYFLLILYGFFFADSTAAPAAAVTIIVSPQVSLMNFSTFSTPVFYRYIYEIPSGKNSSKYFFFAVCHSSHSFITR